MISISGFLLYNGVDLRDALDFDKIRKTYAIEERIKRREEHEQVLERLFNAEGEPLEPLTLPTWPPPFLKKKKNDDDEAL